MSNIYQNMQLDRIATAIENGDAGGGTLTVNLTGVGDMQPATASTAGAHGLVPAPQAGDNDKFLTGAGTFETPTGGGMPDYSNIITSGTYNMFDGFNYTATSDCFVFVMVACSSSLSYPSISINNNPIGYIWSQTSGIEFPLFIPLKAGDVLDVSATNQGNNWPESYIIFSA